VTLLSHKPVSCLPQAVRVAVVQAANFEGKYRFSCCQGWHHCGRHAANFEESACQLRNNDMNANSTLVCFELLEFIVHIALSKHSFTCDIPDASDAVELLSKSLCILPCVSPLAMEGPNEFRLRWMYVESSLAVLLVHSKFVWACSRCLGLCSLGGRALTYCWKRIRAL
jgi:hypothetical protein